MGLGGGRARDLGEISIDRGVWFNYHTCQSVCGRTWPRVSSSQSLTIDPKEVWSWRTHHRDAEVTEVTARSAENHVFAFILGGLWVSVMRIPAKQSQFEQEVSSLNCQVSGKEGQASMLQTSHFTPDTPVQPDGRCKTKPIGSGSFKFQVGSFKRVRPQSTVPGHRLPASCRAGPGTQNKANFRMGRIRTK